MHKYFLLSLCLVCLSKYSLGQTLYFPPIGTDEWETTDPATLNYCPDRIAALYDYLETEQTKGFILLKDGRIVLERYFGTYEQDSLWFWASAGKSLRATLVGIAQERGFLDITQPTSDFLGTGWSSLTPVQEARITVWHQLTMTSGLSPLPFECTSSDCLTYIAPPETFWAYHNGPYNLTKDVLEAATGQTLNRITNTWVRNRIGMQRGFWLPRGDNTMYFSRTRDMARFGLMIQAGGQWDGEAILTDTTYFREMTTPSQSLNPSYGYLWWLNGQAAYVPPNGLQEIEGWIAPNAPEDVIVAAGSQGQLVSISRTEGLMMIRQGRSTIEDLAAVVLHDRIWEHISNLACTTTSTVTPTVTKLEVFPNPATDRVHLANLPTDVTQIQLIDMTGRMTILPVANRWLDISRYPKGVYQLRAQHNGVVWVTKLTL